MNQHNETAKLSMFNSESKSDTEEYSASHYFDVLQLHFHLPAHLQNKGKN